MVASPHDPPKPSSTEVAVYQEGSKEGLLTRIYNDVSTKITDATNLAKKNDEEHKKIRDEAFKKSGGWPALTPEGEAIYDWFASTKAKKQKAAFYEEYNKLRESESQKRLMDSPF